MILLIQNYSLRENIFELLTNFVQDLSINGKRVFAQEIIGIS